MKMLLLTLLTAGIYGNTEPSLAELRNCYQQAATQKNAAEKLNQLVAMLDTGAGPVLVAYKGANEMIQAKYVINPLTKLGKFNKGKNLLQMAVNRDTTNLETRFLRFSIQSNIPSILNYKDEMVADKRFLLENAGNSMDQELKEIIINYFVTTNSLTETQLKKNKKLNETIITVNEQGEIIGAADKMEAHITGKLHRAFSIFVFNTDGKLLLQQRADHKYHSGGKWTNTCCSHPRQGEQTEQAVHRRLQEEMGFDCELTEVFSFRYCETLENNLIENEFDHVFFGISDQLPVPELSEVKDFKYIDVDYLQLQLKTNPADYTIWLNICFDRVLAHYKLHMNHETSNF